MIVTPEDFVYFFWNMRAWWEKIHFIACMETFIAINNYILLLFIQSLSHRVYLFKNACMLRILVHNQIHEMPVFSSFA